MFRWGKKDKNSQTLQEFYQNRKYDQDYNWIDYYRPNRRKGGYGWGDSPGRDGGGSPGRRTAYRVVAVLTILVLLLVVKEFNHPVGEDMKDSLRYVLTTDWNVRPAMEKAVKFGLQVAGVDTPLDSGMPQEGMKEAMGKPAAVAKNILVPVSGKVVRPYGWNKDPLDDLERFHHGIDIAANAGAPVKSVLAGKVVKVGSSEQYGKYVVIDHGDGVYSLYAGIGNVKVSGGQAVKAGDLLGEVAKNGDVKEGGLHFELRESGSLVDPLSRLEFPAVR